MIVRISKTNTITLRVVEEPQRIAASLLRENLCPVEQVFGFYAVDCLARPYTVGVVGKTQRLRVLGRSSQAPARPVKAPAEIARRVTYRVVGDGLGKLSLSA